MNGVTDDDNGSVMNSAPTHNIMNTQLQRLAMRPKAFLPARPGTLAAVVAPRMSLCRFASTSPSVPSAASAAFEDAPATSPRYKTKKVWPPDFTRLSPQEQLRFEKRFKRRVALRSARPRWIKFVKLAQLFSVTFVVIYCVLFMEWEHGPQPFDGVRAWFWDTLGVLQGGQRNAVRTTIEGEKRAGERQEPAAQRSER